MPSWPFIICHCFANHSQSFVHCKVACLNPITIWLSQSRALFGIKLERKNLFVLFLELPNFSSFALHRISFVYIPKYSRDINVLHSLRPEKLRFRNGSQPYKNLLHATNEPTIAIPIHDHWYVHHRLASSYHFHP